MATALLSAKANSVIDSEYPREIFLQDQVTGAATVKPGSIVKIDTADPDVTLATGDPTDWDATEQPYGVAIEREDLDLDTAFADNLPIKVAPLGQDACVNIEIITDSGAILKGDRLYLSTVAGKANLVVIATAATPTVNEILAHERIFIGTAMEDSANDATNTRWIKVKLS